jgi:hypothetical protein
MSKRRPGLAFSVALAALAAAWVGGARSALAETPRVAVAPVAGDHATAEVKDHVGRSLAEGLLASGADVAASPAEAPYVLRGRVEVEGRSYTLHLEMLDRHTGVVVASREDRCEICTEAEAFETASAAASTLKAQVFKKTAAASAPASGSPSMTSPSSTAVAAASGPAPSPSSAALGAPAPNGAGAAGGPAVDLQAGPTPSPHRGLGWASVAAGVVSGAAGGVLLGIDGSGTCSGPDTCPNVYKTRWGGVALIGVGIVAIGTGVLAILGKL